jgi:drug/metabolite transporter (DMT)-like permease
MRRGVAFGVMAGALWGTVFLGPRLLADFSPLLLSAGRYIMYGIVSLAVALPMARRLAAKLTRADLLALTRLALTGNIVYYILLSMAVHAIGIAPASLIIGVLPLTVTLMGRRDHDAVPLRRLAPPLALVVAGIACINVDVFVAPAAGTDAGTKLLGLASAVGALACWTWFAVENARYLKKHHHFDGNEWSLLWGLVTGALGAMLWGAVALLPAGLAQPAMPAHRWETFWLVNLCLAIGASWLGNALWNAASKRLPLTLSGQMIVFETLFALVFGFAYAQRAPRWLEIAAIVLLVAGVSWSVREHSGRDNNTPDSGDNQRPRTLEDDAQTALH